MIKQKLKTLVSPQEPTIRGTVISIKESSIFVKAKTGVREFAVPSPANFNEGDLVKFQGQVLLGKIARASQSQIFIV